MPSKLIEAIFQKIENISDNEDMKSDFLKNKFNESLTQLSLHLESIDTEQKDESLIRARIYAMELEALFADIVEEIEKRLT